MHQNIEMDVPRSWDCDGFWLFFLYLPIRKSLPSIFSNQLRRMAVSFIFWADLVWTPTVRSAPSSPCREFTVLWRQTHWKDADQRHLPTPTEDGSMGAVLGKTFLESPEFPSKPPGWPLTLSNANPTGQWSLCDFSPHPQPILEESVTGSYLISAWGARRSSVEGWAAVGRATRPGLAALLGGAGESPRCEVRASAMMHSGPFSRPSVILSLFPDSSERQPRSVQICRECWHRWWLCPHPRLPSLAPGTPGCSMEIAECGLKEPPVWDRPPRAHLLQVSGCPPLTSLAVCGVQDGPSALRPLWLHTYCCSMSPSDFLPRPELL